MSHTGVSLKVQHCAQVWSVSRAWEIDQTMIAAGCKSQVKIMVGGAPITQAFADEIGADAYTPDAGAAAVKAVSLVSA